MESGGSAKRKSAETNFEEKNNEEITLDELEKNICNSIKQLKKLHHKVKSDGKISPLIQHESRRVMGRAIDNVLKNMQKLVDVCHIDGFVYGIIPENGKPISAASENLQYWWKEKVKFDRNAPAAIVKYKQKKGSNSNKEILNLNREDKNASLRNLHDIQDTTLATLLSCLMHGCYPPQRMYPFENGVAPPWWPKGNEEWLPLLPYTNNSGPPPYRKPHDLKKSWKVIVLVSIIKHMSPDFKKIRNFVRKSKKLQNKMSVKEIANLAAVLNHEEFLNKVKMFPKEVPTHNDGFSEMFHETNDYDVEGNVDIVAFEEVKVDENNIVGNKPQQFSNMVPFETNDQGNNLLVDANLDLVKEDAPRNNIKVIRPIASKRARYVGNEIYTCDSVECPYHNHQIGFHDMDSRDYHQLNCPYRSKYFQFTREPKHGQALMKTTKEASSSVFKPFVKQSKQNNFHVLEMKKEQQQNPQLYMERDLNAKPFWW